MALSLVVGPAHAGKVALLLERFLGVLDRDPWLIVPNRADVERVERDLLRRSPALLAGRIGTFDDLFAHLASGDPGGLELLTDAQRTLVARRAISAAELDGLSASAGSGGFADVLLGTLGELESALVDPERVEGDLGLLARAYRDELDRLGAWDRDGLRRAAAERLQSDLGAWDGAPVLAYGFEDLTAAEWALIEALAARTEVTVSIPYEPGRAAFAALERTVGDLAGLAAGSIEELPPATDRPVPAALTRIERELFVDSPSAEIPLDGSVHFLEGSGARGTAELVAGEILSLVRAGTPPERIGVVCESVERWRTPFETVLGPLGIPYAIEQRARLGETALGGALLALLRFDWLGGGRGELFSFLRSPFSGLERRSVDYVEGRLRGRAVVEPARVEEETEKLRGAPIPALAELRFHDQPVVAVRALVRLLVRNAWGLEAPPTADHARGDARAYEAIRETLDELESFERRNGTPLAREDVVTALERATVRPTTQGEAGRVAVLDYARARTRTFDAVILLGLEEGSLPRRDRPLRCSTTTRAARSDLGSSARTPWRATAISSTRPARGRPCGSCSCGRLRATRARRARRARSGTTCARSSRRTTSPARRAGARCRASPGRSRPRRASESASAHSPASRSTTRTAPPPLPPPTAGRDGSTGRARRSTGRPRSRARPFSSRCRAGRCSPRRSSSASPTARRPGSSSA